MVERTFGWLMRHRWLVRDYERVPVHREAMVLRIMIMMRLVSHVTGSPPQPQWGGARPTPAPSPDKTTA